MKEIRSPKGVRLGDRVPVNGKCGIHVKQGKREDTLSVEQYVECVTGRKVIQITFGEIITT